MIRHVAVFRFHPHTTAAEVEALTAGLKTLPGLVPGIRHYTVGADARITGGNADFAVVADFDDPAAWQVYMAHPAHVDVAERLMAPIRAERMAVQFEV